MEALQREFVYVWYDFELQFRQIFGILLSALFQRYVPQDIMKVGFKYQWTTEGVDVPLMCEKRTGHVNAMTKEEWLAK